jgi:hypothetical protein
MTTHKSIRTFCPQVSRPSQINPSIFQSKKMAASTPTSNRPFRFIPSRFHSSSARATLLLLVLLRSKIDPSRAASSRSRGQCAAGPGPRSEELIQGDFLG